MELSPALVQTLQDVAQSRGRVVVLTGAGTSAESGIPTFRGKEGYWTVGSTHYQPMEMATRTAFAAMPHEVWRWYLYRRSVCRAAEPNPGHRALVKLERALGERFNLITQNVDGLHLRAGHDKSRTFQIHGNVDYMRCPGVEGREVVAIPDGLDQFGREDPLQEHHLALLRRPGDDEIGRPHVLWFDEYYDEELFSAESAMRCAAEADLLLVVGTAGATNLPMQIGQLSARRGIPMVDVNVATNPFAELAAATPEGHVVQQPSAAALPAIVDALLA
ncbi:MAG: RNA polymerase subunit sigma [Deltaproteobacteria bacterium]|nr:RNA polymerase subunit sigma [Deltaproteobacteria bacterium]